MILTKTFPKPDAVLDYFNAPANAALRLVSVLPDATGFMALYEPQPHSPYALEVERQRLLEERVLTLWQLDDDRKLGLGFPKVILDTALVPLSVVSNKLGHLAAFKDMDTRHRNQWVRENCAAVGCAYVPSDEAREHYGSAAELIRIEAE